MLKYERFHMSFQSAENTMLMLELLNIHLFECLSSLLQNFVGIDVYGYDDTKMGKPIFTFIFFVRRLYCKKELQRKDKGPKHLSIFY